MSHVSLPIISIAETQALPSSEQKEVPSLGSSLLGSSYVTPHTISITGTKAPLSSDQKKVPRLGSSLNLLSSASLPILGVRAIQHKEVQSSGSLAALAGKGARSSGATPRILLTSSGLK